MRRLIAAAAMSTVLLGGAGCAGTSQQDAGTPPGGSAAGSPSATGPSADAGLSSPGGASSSPGGTGSAPGATGNTKEVCAEIERLNTTSAATITATLKTFFDKAMKGEQVTEAESNKVLQDMTAQAKKWIDSLEKQSAKATDPELRKAVSDLATSLEPLETGKASMKQMGDIVEKSKTDLARYCG
jgi:hypothetical protein